MTVELRAPDGDDELRECWRMLHRSFNFPLADEDKWLEEALRDRCLVVVDDGEVAAFSQLRPFGQFFGGRSVPMGGYSPVGTAPEHRGRGHASRVTEGHYPLMRERGEVVAALYPASTALYRKVGFEVAGVSHRYKVETRHLQRVRPVVAPERIRRLGPDDEEAVRACYLEVAARRPGWLDRGDHGWWRIFRNGWDTQHVYGVDAADGSLAGYVRYTHGPPEGLPFGFSIVVGELATDDPDVAASLWHLLGTSSTLAPVTFLSGTSEHDLLLQLPEQDLDTVGSWRWMLRVVDAPGAVAARGFPTAVGGAVDLHLTDPQCDWNEGAWRLTVEGGRGELVKGGDGTVRLTAPALAALYAGYADPQTLVRTGSLTGASTADLDVLRAAFTTTTPWMVDFF